MTHVSETDFLTSIFMPRAWEKLSETVKPEGPDFVHYTRADNLLNMLRGKAIWMRNTRCMNDVSEILHGIKRLEVALGEHDRQKRLLAALDACCPGVAADALSLFDIHLPGVLDDTYITCVSEHDPRENNHGRLSMWRAYGQDAVGVAIVIDKSILTEGVVEGDVGAYATPVAYLTDEEVGSDVERVIKGIELNCEALKLVHPLTLNARIFNMLLFAVASLKHPGFDEEREWRIIHAPKVWNSNILKSEIVALAGIPQRIFKIPLVHSMDGVTINLSPDQLIKRVIIGPSNYPKPIQDAIIAALEDAGVQDAAHRVVSSDIPLRMQM